MPYPKVKRQLKAVKYIGFLLLVYGVFHNVKAIISVGVDYTLISIIAGLCLVACSSIILQLIEQLEHEHDLLKEEVKGLRRRIEP